jgi:ATP-binding cassette subfamily F protein 3
MPILSATDLYKAYGPQDVFDQVTVSIAHGEKIGLVGPNGEGKTTLIRVLIGLDVPTAGTVDRMHNARIGYLPQHAELSGSETPWEVCCDVFAELQQMQDRLHALEKRLADSDSGPEALERYGRLQEAFEHAGGYEYEVTVRTVLNGLGMDNVHMHRSLDLLSGGQRTRVLLARLLLEKPSILVLDEPTNHLDLQAIEWLESYLQDWPEALLVVSHDRRFLDKVVIKIWELAFERVQVYRGNYQKYVQLRRERRERQQTVWEEQQEHIAEVQEFVRRNKAGQLSRQAQGREKQLEHMERVARPQEMQTISLRIEPSERSGDLVLRTRDLVVGYDAPLLAVSDLELRRLHRAALIGPNGSGKTTFLKTILGDLDPLHGEARLGASLEIGYWAQSRQELDPESDVVDEILRITDMSTAEARDFLARFLFTGEEVFKRVGDLSGGEQCRVALAKLTLAAPNFLVLDEPTNQLDIPSQEIVEQVLLDFAGTVLFVSHDRYLIDRLATQVWAIDEGRLRVYEGNYQEYLARRQAELAAQRQEAEERRRAERLRRHEERQQAARERQPERTIQEVEAEITALENEQHELERQLAHASVEGDLDTVRSFDVEYQQVQAKLEVLMAEWTALGEAIE